MLLVLKYIVVDEKPYKIFLFIILDMTLHVVQNLCLFRL